MFYPGDRVEVIEAPGFCNCHVGRKTIVLSTETYLWGSSFCDSCKRKKIRFFHRVAFTPGPPSKHGGYGFDFRQLRKLPKLVVEESTEEREIALN